MSASREKKNRQDLASQGIQDPKAIREAEEKAQQRKANRLYGAIAVVFVLVAALLVVVNSGVLERSATAITVDGENYTAAHGELLLLWHQEQHHQLRLQLLLRHRHLCGHGQAEHERHRQDAAAGHG